MAQRVDARDSREDAGGSQGEKTEGGEELVQRLVASTNETCSTKRVGQVECMVLGLCFLICKDEARDKRQETNKKISLTNERDEAASGWREKPQKKNEKTPHS
ncbi:uncharacterized protein SPSK_02066 [Sporothrix schenckii 1099-18]|uniref:Uncharacterized protein n=1 Tax=Sporothrix schenckii 1099-18 TaxID=1397361 RepID=A0A0F2MDH5_SPOSC|nr:uncharacterized protein SPSK_02066 [Sporothrix schenckii 1099-18]KJR86910.1 hypothetical protein SPSK_02066 [Sporothrix schenckii 1099-18]